MVVLSNNESNSLIALLLKKMPTLSILLPFSKEPASHGFAVMIIFLMSLLTMPTTSTEVLSFVESSLGVSPSAIIASEEEDASSTPRESSKSSKST